MIVAKLWYFLLISFCVAHSYNPIIFDPFTTQSILSASQGHEFSSRIAVNNQIWGEERDLSVYLSTPNSQSDIISCNIQNGQATVSSTTKSGITFQYDGRDDRMKFTNNSMAPQNFYEGNAEGFKIQANVVNDASVLLSVYTGFGICTYIFSVTENTQDYLLEFHRFRNYQAPCNFTSVSGVELSFLFERENSCNISFFGTYSNSNVPGFVDLLVTYSSIYQYLYSSSSLPLIISQPSECCFSSIIGGQRDLYLDIEGLSSNSFLQSNISNGQWNLQVGSGFVGFALFQYDGSDISKNLRVNGLNNLDFTDENSKNAFSMKVTNNQVVSFEVIVYVAEGSATVSGRNSFSVIPSHSASLIVPFASFTPPMDFSNVGAIEMTVHMNGATTFTLWDFGIISV